MKNNPFALLLIVFFMAFVSCKKEQAKVDPSNKKEVLQGNPTGGNQWIQIQPPVFTHSINPFNTSFTVNEKVYTALQNPNQLWQYDLTTSTWTLVKAPFFNFTWLNYDCRYVFVNGNNVYFLTNNAKSLKQYNILTGQWTDMTPFPGSDGTGLVTYTSTKGYVMSGAGTSDTENWEYDFAANTWTQKANTPSSARIKGAAFAVGDKVYYGLGLGYQVRFNPITFKATYTQVVESDWWEYNTTTNTWAAKATFPGGARWSTRGFVLNGKGYVGVGIADVSFETLYSDLWSYNPASNTWSQMANFPPGYTGSLFLTMVATSTQGYAIYDDLRSFWLYEPPYTIVFPKTPQLGTGSTIQNPQQ